MLSHNILTVDEFCNWLDLEKMEKLEVMQYHDF